MDNLLSMNWVPVPNAPYIMKYVFYDTGYHIMVSNLTSLYSEKLEETSILKRFCELNPFALMKLQVILENLRKSLEKCVTQVAELDISASSTKFIASLEFSAGLVLCKYKFEMDLLDNEKITQHIICPTIFNALLSQRKFLELQKMIIANDSTNASSASYISVSAQESVDPDWLTGKNISTENLLHSFLKIQNCFKDLCAENSEAYEASRKEKLRPDHSVLLTSANKKFKLQENLDDESNSIKYDNNEEKISIKNEEATSSDYLTSQMKSNVKKKTFKI